MSPSDLKKLCADHEGLVKRLVHRHRRQWLLNGPIEDHLQVGRMALVLAAGTWQPGKGSSFPTWANDAIRWELQKYDKVGSAAKHSLRAEQVREIRSAVARGEAPPSAKSLGVSEQDLAMVLEPPEQFTEIRDHGACDLGMPEMRMALEELSAEDKRIVQALALGITPNRIAKDLKKDLAYVQAAMERIRTALS